MLKNILECCQYNWLMVNVHSWLDWISQELSVRSCWRAFPERVAEVRRPTVNVVSMHHIGWSPGMRKKKQRKAAE